MHDKVSKKEWANQLHRKSKNGSIFNSVKTRVRKGKGGTQSKWGRAGLRDLSIGCSPKGVLTKGKGDLVF